MSFEDLKKSKQEQDVKSSEVAIQYANLSLSDRREAHRKVIEAWNQSQFPSVLTELKKLVNQGDVIMGASQYKDKGFDLKKFDLSLEPKLRDSSFYGEHDRHNRIDDGNVDHRDSLGFLMAKIYLGSGAYASGELFMRYGSYAKFVALGFEIWMNEALDIRVQHGNVDKAFVQYYHWKFPNLPQSEIVSSKDYSYTYAIPFTPSNWVDRTMVERVLTKAVTYPVLHYTENKYMRVMPNSEYHGQPGGPRSGGP